MHRRIVQKIIIIALLLVLLITIYTTQINPLSVLGSYGGRQQPCFQLPQQQQRRSLESPNSTSEPNYRRQGTTSNAIDSINNSAGGEEEAREEVIAAMETLQQSSQPRRHPPSALSSFFKTNYTSETFTIIVPTYKRNFCIYTGLRHYCKMEHVEMIIVLWNNIDEEIPRYLRKLRCKPKLKYIEMEKNRMTTRYIPRSDIQTEAILALDDDRIVSEESLMLAYRTWKLFPHKIIGFCSRTFGLDSNGQYIYDPLKRIPYSLILPNAAFIHRNYLDMFTETFPRHLYQYIDDHINVDDIAMNVMIADFLRKMGEPQCSGFLVSGNMTECKVTGSEYKGLWLRKNHNEVRTEYLRLINQTYNYMPLVECDIAITNTPNMH